MVETVSPLLETDNGPVMSQATDFTSDFSAGSDESVTTPTKIALSPEEEVVRLIYVCGLPIILTFGCFGNGLSFVIMMRKKMRDSSTSFYFAVLAVTDTIYLLSYVPAEIAFSYSRYALDISVYVKCVNFYTLFVFSEVSAWIIVAVSCERVVAVFFPLKAKSICTVKRAQITCLTVIVVIMMINIPHLIAWVPIPFPGSSTYCSAGPAMPHYILVIWPFLAAFIYSFLPSCSMTVMNVLIIWKLYKTRRETAESAQTISKNARKMTITLLTVSFSFITLTVPITIAMVYIGVFDLPTRKVYYACSDLLVYSNHSINFLLYTISAEKFRKELRSLFHCGQNVVHPITSTTDNNSVMPNK